MQHLDISLNEVGPQGFQSLCEVLPQTKLQSLICNKNFLLENVLQLFTQTLPQTQLKRFEFSHCKLVDQDLLALIEQLSTDKQV